MARVKAEQLFLLLALGALRSQLAAGETKSVADDMIPTTTLLQTAISLNQDPDGWAGVDKDPRVVREIDIIKNALDPPKYINETRSEAFSAWVFLHVGKAGGGTITFRADQMGLNLSKVHPDPPLPDAIAEYSNVMINIRDPIDRFVSAFNWQVVVCCDKCDTRRNGYARASRHPDLLCEPCGREESDVLQNKYQRNVSMLAEALCADSEDVRQGAAADVKQIKHAKHTLSDWLAASEIETKEKLSIFVLEPGFDFYSQVDAGFIWASSAWAEADNGFELSSYEFPATWGDEDQNSHSSDAYGFPDLTELGARCLAQYYSEDYQALDSVMQSVESWCHGAEFLTCQAALQSILSRRANLRNS